jgi:alkylated DNA repair dioxygenase AlkB
MMQRSICALDQTHQLAFRCLANDLMLSPTDHQALWELHPEKFPTITIHGKQTPIPRWQQAYGMDYHFSGQTTRALPMPKLLLPILGSVRQEIDPRLNGVLVNWYDASQGHYIGAHRDSTKGMCPGAPIVMVSLGAERVMRLRRWKGQERFDFIVKDGTVCVLPYETNLAWTHEILRRKQDTGRRISVTFRAFDEASPSS